MKNLNNLLKKLSVFVFVVGVIFFGIRQVMAINLPGNGIWNSSGNVGIGTTAPGVALDVKGNASIYGGTLSLGGAGNDIMMMGKSGTSWGYNIRTDTNFGLYFLTRQSGRTGILFDDNGNVGIGTTAPTQKLDVSGSFRTSSADITALGAGNVMSDASGNLYTGASSSVSGSGSSNYLSKWTSSSNLGSSQIYDNGTNVGLGTTAPGAKLDVAGTIRSTSGGVTYPNGSTQSNAAQVNYGSFTVGGSSSSYYPVQFVTSVYNSPSSAASDELVIYRSNVHENASWDGTFNFDISFHPTDYGHFYGQIEKITYQTGQGSPYNDPVGDVMDGSTSGGGHDLIVWLKGGATYHWRNRDATAGWSLANGNSAGGNITDSSGASVAPITSQSSLISNAKNRFFTSALGLGGSSLYVTGSSQTQSLNVSGLGGSGNVAVMADNSGNLYTASGSSIGSGSSGQTLRNNGTSWVANSVIYNNGTNVAIGSTNPGYAKLWVNGDIWMSGNNSKLAFTTDGTTDNTPNASIIASQNGISGASADLIFNTWNGSSNVEIMRVRSNGTVGIGTSAPGYPLEVAGNTSIGGKALVAGNTNEIWTQPQTNANATLWINYRGYANGTTQTRNLAVGNGEATALFYVNGASGNTGVGTTGPGQKLEVNGNIKLTASNPYIYSGGSWIGIPNGLYVSGGTTYIQGVLNARNQLHNDSAAYLTISGGTSGYTYFSGNVGIGVTNPSYPLQVSSNIYAGSSVRAPIFYDANNTGYYLDPASTSNLNVVLSNSSRLSTGADLNSLTHWQINDVYTPANGVSGQTWHNVMTIPSADTGYISQLNFAMVSNYPNMWMRTKTGGTWHGWVKFIHDDGSGNVTVPGSVTASSFVYSSDRTLKKNIKDLTPSESLANIQKLQGVSFNWKSNGEPQVGLIAQDVQKVYPELVHGETGHMGVQYGNLVAPLIEAVKAQQTEIKTLQMKVSDLQQQVQTLQK